MDKKTERLVAFIEEQAKSMFDHIHKVADQPTVEGLSEEMAKIIEPQDLGKSPYSIYDVLLTLAFLVAGTMPTEGDPLLPLIQRRTFDLLLDEIMEQKFGGDK